MKKMAQILRSEEVDFMRATRTASFGGLAASTLPPTPPSWAQTTRSSPAILLLKGLSPRWAPQAYRYSLAISQFLHDSLPTEHQDRAAAAVAVAAAAAAAAAAAVVRFNRHRF